MRLNRPNAVPILVCLFAATLLALVWAMTLYAIADGKRGQAAMAERDARSFARAFEEHTARTLEAADQSLNFLRFRYNALGQALDIGADLNAGLLSGEIYNLFTVVDRHANVVLSSKPFAPTNLADREHIRIHMGSASDVLFISKPVLGRVSKKWSIQTTRRVSAPDGSFNGVVVASIDPTYFTALYHDIGLGKHGSVSLIGLDGTARAHHTGGSDAGGQDRSGSALFKAMQANGNGVLTAVSDLDGRRRVLAYRKLKHFPLYVAVGIDLDERLSAFEATRVQALQIAGLTSVIILIFAVSIMVLVGRLVASRAQAIAASKAKSHFLSNMSHELRTPLSGILGYSELLVADLGGTEQASYALGIQASGERLLALVNAVLDLSALDAGMVKLSLSSEHLAGLLRQALGRHAAAASARGVALELAIAPDVPAHLTCDGKHVGKVLDCLLHNAVRFSARAVRLDVTRSGAGLQVAVSDDGSGVPLERQHHIFERFVQADASGSRPQQGAGIGLAIAQKLAALMDGHISLLSEPGHGARFSFILPIHGPRPPLAA